MKNWEVFKDFDMVVSITQKAINDQLMHLQRLGEIHSKLTITRDCDDHGNYTYKVLKPEDQIPVDKEGKPTVEYISGHIQPKVVIDESSSNIILIIKFINGEANFWRIVGQKIKQYTYEMKDWAFALNVNLDFFNLEKQSIANKKLNVPTVVTHKLHKFVDDMFSVKCLFMDLQNTKLDGFNTNHTNVPNQSDTVVEVYVNFMCSYLKYCKNHGNPFILGYSINAKKQSKDTNMKVPLTLKPAGATYTMFKDTKNPQLSNINYVLVTEGGHKAIKRSPDKFDYNWFYGDVQCDGKMIYSHQVLVEDIILKPFYKTFSTKVREQLNDKINTGDVKSYESAKRGASKGYRFVEGNYVKTDNRYENSYEVSFERNENSTIIQLDGYIDIYKKKSNFLGKAWAECTLSWRTIINIIEEKDKQGNPSLKFTYKNEIINCDKKSHIDDAVKLLDLIGGLIKKIIDIINVLGSFDFLEDLVDSIFKMNTPEIGEIDKLFDNYGKSMSNFIMLPAGHIFFMKKPICDYAGNMIIDLTYKSDS